MQTKKKKNKTAHLQRASVFKKSKKCPEFTLLKFVRRLMSAFWTTFMLLFNVPFVYLCICVSVYLCVCVSVCLCSFWQSADVCSKIPVGFTLISLSWTIAINTPQWRDHTWKHLFLMRVPLSFPSSYQTRIPISFFSSFFLKTKASTHSRQERRKRLSKEKEAQRRQERSRQSQNLFLLQVVDHWADQRTAQIHKYFVPTVRMY